MVHINSHSEPDRAKRLDLANKTVKGSIGSGHRRSRCRWKQLYHQWERRSAGRTYRHLRNFRCSEMPNATVSDVPVKPGLQPAVLKMLPGGSMWLHPLTTWVVRSVLGRSGPVGSALVMRSCPG